MTFNVQYKTMKRYVRKLWKEMGLPINGERDMFMNHVCRERHEDRVRHVGGLQGFMSLHRHPEPPSTYCDNQVVLTKEDDGKFITTLTPFTGARDVLHMHINPYRYVEGALRTPVFDMLRQSVEAGKDLERHIEWFVKLREEQRRESVAAASVAKERVAVLERRIVSLRAMLAPPVQRPPTKRRRYACSKCGQPKKGHICAME